MTKDTDTGLYSKTCLRAKLVTEEEMPDTRYNIIMKTLRKLFHTDLHECPICSWKGRDFKLLTYPNKPAVCSVCPNCNSYERHRFAYLALKLPASDRTLHIAPEGCLRHWVKAASKEYVTIDLNSARGVTANMDIRQLAFKDNSFSLVWCSHVLEHIDQDSKTMGELYRVLKPTGLAIVLVPIYGDMTYEDAAIVTPEARLEHFGQKDHVRKYGLDIRQRLNRVGFAIDTITLGRFPLSTIARYGLDYPSTREIFVCSK